MKVVFYGKILYYNFLIKNEFKKKGIRKWEIANLLYWERCSHKNIENLEGFWLIANNLEICTSWEDFFKAVVESVLLYGSFAWALTKRLENKFNGTYKRMIGAILDISTHPSEERLYGNLI